DDQEFMTAFECDEPADFMHLMLTLRESEASQYTERDTPIFVGQHVSIRSALDALDGASARVRAYASTKARGRWRSPEPPRRLMAAMTKGAVDACLPGSRTYRSRRRLGALRPRSRLQPRRASHSLGHLRDQHQRLVRTRCARRRPRCASA